MFLHGQAGSVKPRASEPQNVIKQGMDAVIQGRAPSRALGLNVRQHHSCLDAEASEGLTRAGSSSRALTCSAYWVPGGTINGTSSGMVGGSPSGTSSPGRSRGSRGGISGTGSRGGISGCGVSGEGMSDMGCILRKNLLEGSR
jgi:hypothetical protein